ncbi:MAG: hypothetical protein ACREKH_14185, partial [Candidatus Rokuibacteriota bacterium]
MSAFVPGGGVPVLAGLACDVVGLAVAGAGFAVWVGAGAAGLGAVVCARTSAPGGIARAAVSTPEIQGERVD